MATDRLGWELSAIAPTPAATGYVPTASHFSAPVHPTETPNADSEALDVAPDGVGNVVAADQTPPDSVAANGDAEPATEAPVAVQLPPLAQETDSSAEAVVPAGSASATAGAQVAPF